MKTENAVSEGWRRPHNLIMLDAVAEVWEEVGVVEEEDIIAAVIRKDGF